MGRPATAASTAVVKADEMQLAKNNIYSVLNNEKTLQAIKTALPDMGVTAERVASIAFSVIATKPSLLECDAKSLIKVIIEGSLLGLSFDPHLKQAAIVPFKQGGVPQATLIIEYMGLVKLARNSGVLDYIDAHVVNERDEFDFQLGLDPNLTHRPPRSGSRGAAVGVYAVGKLTNGDKVFRYLTKDEVEFYREKSRAKDASDSPWNTDPMAMWRKTAIRRLVGYLPMDDKTARAAQDDEMAETGHEQVLAPEVFGMIDITPVEKSKTDEVKDRLKEAKKEAAATAETVVPQQQGESQEPKAEEVKDERGDVIQAIAQLWQKVFKRGAEADIEVSAATGGALKSLLELDAKGTLEQAKQVLTHIRAIAEQKGVAK